MGRASKWLLVSLAAIALVVIVLVLLGGALLGGAIERIGSQATDTPVRVGGVDVAWTHWGATLHDVTIDNPQGFEQRPALTLPAVTLALEPGTLGESPVVVRTMQVAGPVADVELQDDGDTNLAALRRNLQRSKERGEPGPPAGEPGDVAVQKASRMQLRVEELVVGEGRARVRAPELGVDEPVTMPLGSVDLADVGGASGQKPAELTRTIALALVESTARTVTEEAIRETVGAEGIGGAVRDAVEAGADAIEDATGQ